MNPKLPGTIHSAVQAIEKAGGKGLAIQLDIRDAEAVEKAIAKTVETFGGLDILINNGTFANVGRYWRVDANEVGMYSQCGLDDGHPIHFGQTGTSRPFSIRLNL